MHVKFENLVIFWLNELFFIIHTIRPYGQNILKNRPILESRNPENETFPEIFLDIDQKPGNL